MCEHRSAACVFRGWIQIKCVHGNKGSQYDSVADWCVCNGAVSQRNKICQALDTQTIPVDFGSCMGFVDSKKN